MLKGIGIIIIIAVCTMAGFHFSESLRTRQKRLSQFCLLVGDLSDGIRTGKELSQILSAGEAEKLVRLDGFEPKIKSEGLSKKDKAILEEFFSVFGMGDAQSQITRCEAYLGLLKKQEEQAEQQVKAKAALYGKLGFFAGLFIAVMVV